MLVGEYAHSVDAKGRFFIPAKFRYDLGEHFVMTKGFDGCLSLYPMENWKVLEDKIKELPMAKSKDVQRFFFSAAEVCTVDAQGRALITQRLKEYAGLGKDITVVGVSGRAEIWDAGKWAEYSADQTSENFFDYVAEIDL